MDSSFNGLIVENFLQLPTNTNSTVKFRVNIDNGTLEYYYNNRWNSNSLIDLSFNNGIEELLAVDDNLLYDTKSFKYIHTSTNLLASHYKIWNGSCTNTESNNIGIIESKLLSEAVLDWNLPNVENLPDDVHVLKVDIELETNDIIHFLQQQNISIVGPIQTRGYFFVKSENNGLYITNETKLTVSNEWQYIAKKGEHWNPRIEGVGTVELYILVPYYSSGWHGPDLVVWRDNVNRTYTPLNNYPITNNENCVVFVGDVKNLELQSTVFNEETLNKVKEEYVLDLYNYMIELLKDYHVPNFIHHDLITNEFNESVKFNLDRNISDNLVEKYPFLLAKSKVEKHSFMNLSTDIKNKVCNYRLILRTVFLQYYHSVVILQHIDTVGELTTQLQLQKDLIKQLAMDTNTL